MAFRQFPASLATIIGAGFLLNVASCERTGAQSVSPPAEASSVIAARSGSQSDADANPMAQVGPWSPSPANIEEPFINIIHASSVTWTEGREVNTAALYASGVLDPETGLPKKLPNGWMLTDVYFSTLHDKSHWAGDWVLEWETEEPNKADLSMQWLPDNQQRRVDRNRVEFTRTTKNDHSAIAIRRLKSPLTALRIFRKENEAALRAGKIYNPRFVDEVRKYHVVRSMDLQEANRSGITSVDDVATMNACCWNNIAWGYPPRKIAHPFRSMPLEAVVALAIEADNILWHHAPIELGAPKELHDPSIMTIDDDNAVAGAWRNLARENATEILASPEWDAYADKFVSALISAGYPEDRPLYTTVSNEVWNASFYYFTSTNFAWGLGQGLRENGYFRHGYGAALARWKLALDAALERANRRQPVIYVAEGQAANPATTFDALDAMQAYMEQNGEVWSDHSDQIGISVASYWGGMPNWRAAGPVDTWRNPTPQFWQRVESRVLNGPSTEIATKAWILARFADHAREGAKYGVGIIGAYEGGSHFEKPSEMPKAAYAAWHWGEAGARINKAVNEALVEAYPGIVLSNYVLAGPQGGQPWFEGEYGEESAMNESWADYLRQ